MISENSRKRSFDGVDELESVSSSSMRSGKWSSEEECFANRLVFEFERGSLVDCEDGCTLRSYLARKLNCAPMRISKKFAGRCIGKMAFLKKPLSHEVQEEVLMQLEDLYEKSCKSSVPDCKRSCRHREDASPRSVANEIGSDCNGYISSVVSLASDSSDSNSDDDVTSGSLYEEEPSGDIPGKDICIEHFNGFDHGMLFDSIFSAPDILIDNHEWQNVLSFFSDDKAVYDENNMLSSDFGGKGCFEDKGGMYAHNNEYDLYDQCWRDASTRGFIYDDSSDLYQ